MADISVPGSSSRSTVRKRFADLTNILPRPELAVAHQSSGSSSRRTVRETNILPRPELAVEYIDRIVKSHGNDFMKKSVISFMAEVVPQFIEDLDIQTKNLSKQNKELAKCNSRLLREVRSLKDKVSSQDHKIGCLEALLKDTFVAVAGQSSDKTSEDMDSEHKSVNRRSKELSYVNMMRRR